MHIPSRHRVIFGIALGTLAALAASRASAKTPAMLTCGNTTCAHGFTCQVTPGACPAIACLDGADCPPCIAQDSYVCVPSACATDADCGADMVCASHETTQCPVSPPTCAPNQNCSPPAKTDPAGVPINCTTTTYHQCTPRWQLPCQVAAECGAGFTCDEQQSCGCSGGGTVGSGTTPSGASTPAAGTETAPDCTCTGTSACTVIPTVCNTDAECLLGWTCQVAPSSGGCAASPDGQQSCPPPPPVVKNCAPPYASSSGTVVSGTPTPPNHDSAKTDDAPSPFAGCTVAGFGARFVGRRFAARAGHGRRRLADPRSKSPREKVNLLTRIHDRRVGCEASPASAGRPSTTYARWANWSTFGRRCDPGTVSGCRGLR